MARDQAVAAAISIALIAAVVSPVCRSPTDDGFPLSTYPMFAIRREPVQTMVYAIGWTAGGARRAIAPSMVGTAEVLQASATIGNAVGGGSATSRALCDRIAAAAGAEGGEIARVQLVAGTHDSRALLAGEPDPHEHERVIVECAVAR